MKVTVKRHLEVEKKKKGDKYFKAPMFSAGGVDIEITVTINNSECYYPVFSNKFTFDEYEKTVSTSFEMCVSTDPIVIYGTAIECFKTLTNEKLNLPESDIESIDDFIAEFNYNWEKHNEFYGNRLIKLSYFVETGTEYSKVLSHIDYLILRSTKSCGRRYWQVQFEGEVSDYGKTFPERVRFIAKR